jgi:hypothetical protein
MSGCTTDKAPSVADRGAAEGITADDMAAGEFPHDLRRAPPAGAVGQADLADAGDALISLDAHKQRGLPGTLLHRWQVGAVDCDGGDLHGGASSVPGARLTSQAGGVHPGRNKRQRIAMQRRALLAGLAAGIACPVALRAMERSPAEIRMIVPFAPRGGTVVGMSKLASARPDGTTLGLASSGLLAQMATGEVPLRPEQFLPLVRVAEDPAILVVGARSSLRSLASSAAPAARLSAPTAGDGCGGRPGATA